MDFAVSVDKVSNRINGHDTMQHRDAGSLLRKDVSSVGD